MHLVTPTGPLCPRAVALAAAVAAAASLAGCTRDVAATSNGGHANVLLVTVDTLRADALGCYGAPRPTSPHLDALARRSLVFEQAFSSAPWTLPAMASLLTGTFPSLHGETESEGPRSRLPEDLVTIAEALKGAGLDTAAFSAHPWVSPDFGLGQGIAPADFHTYPFPGGDGDVTAAFVKWLAGRKDPAAAGRRFFVHLHYMRPHTPYNPTPAVQRLVLGEVPAPPPFSARLAAVTPDRAFAFLADGVKEGEVTPADVSYLRSQYEAEVRMADEEVGAVLAALREQGLDDDTMVIVTADHGEAFMEHGEMLHGDALYPEMLRIPLIVHLPGQQRGSRVVHRAQNVDVMPTILDALGVPAPPQVQGHTRVPRHDPGETPVFAESTFGTRQVRMMDGALSLLADPEAVRLYDVALDPGESEDISLRSPRATARMSRAVDAFLAAGARRRALLVRSTPVARTAALAEETQAGIRSLGYVR